MRPGGGRSKGNAFERQVAKLICEAFSLDKTHCFRTPLSGGHRFAKQSDPGDLVMSPELRAKFCFSVECKSYRRLDWAGLLSKKKNSQFAKWWRQTKAACNNGARPLLIFKENRSEPFCMFPYSKGPDIGSPVLRSVVDGDLVTVALFRDMLQYYKP